MVSLNVHRHSLEKSKFMAQRLLVRTAKNEQPLAIRLF